MSPDQKAKYLPPGSVIGILGGGQLGRMLAIEAARLGMRCHILAPAGDTPAMQVCDVAVQADYDDEDALRRFAEDVDVITYEFENVPGETADLLASYAPVRPSPQALKICQDRLTEKNFLNAAGIATAPFRAVDSEADMRQAIGELGTPAILKTRRLGYDGKGQALINTLDDAASAWQDIAEAPAILEAFVSFESELSIIAARDLHGSVTCYDAATNVHENHILVRSIVPAQISDAAARKALSYALHIAKELDYVGVLGIEMFLSTGDEPNLFVNELAPRVHNSGHWTLDACPVSQFEQHIRAICGWPVGSAKRHHDAVMENLLGQDVDDWYTLALEPHTGVHIYGKQGAKPGRKMGHVTRLLPLSAKPTKTGG